MTPLARKLAIGAAILVAVVTGGALTGTVWLRSEAGRDWLTRTVTAALSGPGRSATVEGLGGGLPGGIEVQRVRLADAEGVWLELDGLSLHWSPLSLLAGSLWVDRLEAQRLALLRLPQPGPPEPETDGGGPTRLPVSIHIDRVAVPRLEVGAPVAGTAAVVALEADAKVARSLRGQLSLSGRRIDGVPGTVALEVDTDPARHLDFQLRLEEGEGGVASANLPGAPSLLVEASGAGPWDNWQGTLAARAGAATLEANARLQRDGAGRRLQLEASGALASLLPERFAGLAGSSSRVTASAVIPRRGPMTIEKALATGGFGTLSVQGRVDPDTADLDLAYDLAAGPDSGLHVLIVEPVWQSLRLVGTAKGPAAAPAVKAELTAAAPALRRIAGKQLRVAVESSPTQMRDALAVTIQAVVDGLSSEDARLSALAGERLTLQAEGVVNPTAGDVRVKKLAVDAAVATLAGDGTVAGWGREAAATLRLNAHDLNTLGVILNRPLTGAANADITLTKKGERIEAGATLATRDMSLGIPLADALTAGALKAAAKVEMAQGPALGAITVRDLTVTSPALIASGSLQYGAKGATGSLRAELPDLAPLGPALGASLAGRLTVDASVSGPTTDMTVKADAVADMLSVNGQDFSATRLTVQSDGLPQAPRGHVRLDGGIGGKPLGIDAPFATTGSTLKLERMTADLGGNHLDGTLEVLLGAGLANGRITLALDDLATLGRLAGGEAGGRLRSLLVLTARGKEQSVALDANGQDLSWRAGGETASLVGLTLAAKADKVTTAPAVDARLSLAGVSRSDLRLRQLDLTAQGPMTDLALTATGRGRVGRPVELDAAAKVAATSDSTRIAVSRLQGRYGPERFQLAPSATVESSKQGLLVQNVRLSIGSGRAGADLDLRGTAFDGTVTLSALPLRLARLVNPTADVEGTLDGRLALSGSRSDPRADLTLAAKQVRAAGTEALRGFDLGAKGQWRDGRLRLDATADGDGGQPDIVGRAELPLRLADGTLAPELPPDQPIQAQLDGGIDIARFNDLLAAQGDRAAGKLTIHAAIGGTLASPDLSGSAAVDGGRYENVQYGTTVTDLVLRLNGNADGLTIQRLDGRTPGGGKISGVGAVRFAGPGQIDVRLTLDKAQVAAVDLVRATADANLSLSGDFSRSLLSGVVRIRRAEISIPDHLPPDVREIKVVEVNGPMATGSTGPAPEEPAAPPAMDLGLDVALRADNQIYVRGRGLESEFKADLAVKGTAARPLVSGDVTLVKGSLSALGKTFELSKANASFLGDDSLQPQLDVEARAKARDLTAVIQVTGRLPRPTVELTSDPAAPRDEVLARLLFDRPVGELSAFDALQLAQSAGELTGLFGSGPGMMDRLKRSIGVDRLEFRGSESGEGAGALAAGRYVGKRTYVGVEQDLGTGQSKATVEYEINRHINLQAGVGNDNEVGVEFKWDY